MSDMPHTINFELWYEMEKNDLMLLTYYLIGYLHLQVCYDKANAWIRNVFIKELKVS